MNKSLVIPYHDLLYNSDDYHPLGSVKAVRNVPHKQSFVHVDVQEIFTSRDNRLLLAHKLSNEHRKNGGQSPKPKYMQLVNQLIQKYIKEHDINRLHTVDCQAVSQNDYVEILKTVNNRFLQDCYNYLRWNTFVPAREWVEVGAKNNRVQKKFTDLLASDIPTIDVWAVQEVQVSNDVYRNYNKIPYWQTTMHNRHYDKNNEGLSSQNADRASLETPIYSYDMSDINALTDKWTKDEWFGLN